MRIIVQHEHLVKGIVNCAHSGPLALAAQAAGLRAPIVGDKRISFVQGGERVSVELPDEAIRFQRRLHHGDRYEALKVKRNKKGLVVGHEPFVFDIGAGAHRADLAMTA